MNKLTLLAALAIASSQIAVAVNMGAGIPLRAASNAISSDEPNMSCGETYSPSWDNCVGAVRYPNGNIYRGEFHHGAREGLGFIVINAKGTSDSNNILSNEPAVYAGEFRANKLNGRGVWFPQSGDAYSSRFVDNIAQPAASRKNCGGPPSAAWNYCVATLTYGNGNVYRGEFVNGRREGIGMIEIRVTGIPDDSSIRTPVPGVYVGEFRDDRLNGRGMIFMPGAGFYGTFTNNRLAAQLPTI